jgi:1-acyl-sn-glycerol-3-phosphate acyltransferase
MRAVGSRLGRAARPGFPWTAPAWPASLPRPAPPSSLGADYDTDWARREPVRVVRAVLLDSVTRAAVKALASPRVAGLDRVAGLEPPAIFAANHASHVDTPLLLTSLPPRFRHRCVVAAAADYFFDRRWKAALWAFAINAIPVERTRVTRRSIEQATDLLAGGWSLVIFPEGGRSPDGWAQPFRGGAAYLAVHTGLPVVPVHVGGTHSILPRSGRGVRPGTTRVTFGHPLRPNEGEDTRAFGSRIEQAVAVLADERAADWWTARRRAAQGSTPPLTGPPAASWRRAWALERAQDERGTWAL